MFRYTISVVTKENIDAELADKEAAKQAKADALAKLKSRNSNAPVRSEDFEDLLLALGLK